MKRGLIENTHPGELIYEDILKENNLTVSQAAIMLIVTSVALSQLFYMEKQVFLLIWLLG